MPKRIDIPSETMQKVIKLLSENPEMTLNQVIKELDLGINRSTLSRKLRRMNFTEHSKKAPNISKIYSDEDIKEFYNELIENGKSLTEFCDENSISLSTLSLRMKELNLPYTSKQVKSLNHDYFDVLTNNNVYWLGFMLADGYVSNEDNSIELGLKDRDHIEKFKESLDSKHAITEKLDERWDTKLYKIKFHSAKIKERFAQLGIEPLKTYKPYIIPEEIVNSGMLTDFIRGFFDGDGHISESNDGVLQQVGFTSYDKTILLELKDIISRELDIEFKIYNRDDGNYQLSNYKNGDKEKFLNWLYKDSELYLNRKFERYLKHCRPD